jgi:Tol biopolymer transport system component
VVIEAGQQLLHYRLIEKIGEGGMGVVWKATDTSLDREVAIKFLPETFAADEQRLARFEREAKLLASLNHPNVASVYSVHEHDGTRFLAMELVPGEDLAQRLVRAPLQIEDALRLAAQIAEAFEAAHGRGIVHRDLKPANVRLTPDGAVKVLDFGLALALGAVQERGDPSLSPTMTSGGTIAGAILGTAAYMSPEQARGEPVDKRADIWAFGCVLFELLSGRPVFKEKSISDTLASVLKVDPDWNVLPDDVPGTIHRLLRRCLAKSPRQRLHDIADARIEIEGTLADPQAETTSIASPGRARARAWPVLAAVLLLAGAAIGFGIGRGLAPEATEQRVRRFFVPVEAEEGQKPLANPVLSPDGRAIAYGFEGKLWVHEFAQGNSRALDGTEGALLPFWSPDGSQIGFVQGGSLWRVPAAGGQPSLICDQAPLFHLPSWSADQKILFSKSTADGMFEVPARGGAPRVLFGTTNEEAHFHTGTWLPDGRGVLFIAHRDKGNDTIGLWANGERKTLVQIEASVLDDPVYSSTGHILFTRKRDSPGIWAIPFSLTGLKVTGEPFMVIPQARYASVASDGTLVYVDQPPHRAVELVRVDHDGKLLQTLGQPQDDMDRPGLSPDGTRVAVAAQEGHEWDIYVHNDSGSKRRLTFEEGKETLPRWSADGTRIIYEFPEGADASIYSVAADGSGKPQLLTAGEQPMLSRSENLLLFARREEQSGGAFFSMSLDPPGEPQVFLESKEKHWSPELSPDGHLVAYASERGIYLSTFPGGSGKWQVSTGGGCWKVFWSPAGDRLFYHQWGNLMEVEVLTDPELQLGTPRPLFERDEGALKLGRGGAIAEDGRSFVIVRELKPDEDEREVRTRIHVVENWISEYQR